MQMFLIQTTTLFFRRCSRSARRPHVGLSSFSSLKQDECLSIDANEGFYALAGFAKVVGAIDGSLVPIIAPSSASVHPPVESVDRVGPNH